MKKFTLSTKKGIALVLSFALVLSLLVAFNTTDAKKAFVKSLKVSKSSITVEAGKSVTVKATVKTKGSAKKTVSAKSNSTAFAVKAGKASKKGVSVITITGKSVGAGFITVKTKGKNSKGKAVSKNIAVTVNPSSQAAANNNGSSSSSSNTGTINSNVPYNNPNGSGTTPVSDEPADPTVKWSTTEETYDGLFSAEGEDGEVENLPIQLLRKYVSFDPWPTHVKQFNYIIQNCKDPYVIAALYVVALDNMEKPDTISDYTNKVFDMLEAIQTGAGAITGDNLKLNNFAKQHINEYWSKTASNGSKEVLVREFASRTFLKGAKDTNNYTPEGGLTDKTKWQIIVDQYPYCFDQEEGHEKMADKRWVTLCPRRFTYLQDVENGPLVEQEHSQVLRIGFRWNQGKNVWVSTDYAVLNNNPGSAALVPYDVKASILFSNNYRAPQVSQGF